MISEEQINKLRDEVLDRVRKKDENAWVVVDKQQGMFGDVYVFSIHRSNGVENYLVEENPFMGIGWRAL